MDGGAAHKLGVGQEHQGVLGAMVGIGEVDGLAALLGVGHAGDDGVDLSLVQGLDQAAPGQLHNDQFAAQGVGNVLCDLHIVAFGIGAGHVLNRPVGVGGGVFLPVAGSIGALHTHAELLDFSGGRFGCGGFRCGSLGGGGGAAAAAGGKSKDHEGCKQHTDNSSGHFHFHPFKRYRFCLLWVLQYKKPWLRVSHPWLNDKIAFRERPRNFPPTIALHKICDSPADILRQPNRKRSEPFPISAILPFTPSRALTPYVMRATDNDRASTIVPAPCLAPGNY